MNLFSHEEFRVAIAHFRSETVFCSFHDVDEQNNIPKKRKEKKSYCTQWREAVICRSSFTSFELLFDLILLFQSHGGQQRVIEASAPSSTMPTYSRLKPRGSLENNRFLVNQYLSAELES